MSSQTLRAALLTPRYPTIAHTGESHWEAPPEVTVRARTHVTVPTASPRSSTSARIVTGSGFHSSPVVEEDPIEHVEASQRPRQGEVAPRHEERLHELLRIASPSTVP